MDDWPVEVDGKRYHPIPESWITAPTAVDGERFGTPRIYAVSVAALNSRTLEIRYGDPETQGVLPIRQLAVEASDGLVPERLAQGREFKRSVTVPPRQAPVDVLRGCEQEHLDALWRARRGAAAETKPLVADGGESISHSTVYEDECNTAGRQWAEMSHDERERVREDPVLSPADFAGGDV